MHTLPSREVNGWAEELLGPWRFSGQWTFVLILQMWVRRWAWAGVCWSGRLRVMNVFGPVRCRRCTVEINDVFLAWMSAYPDWPSWVRPGHEEGGWASGKFDRFSLRNCCRFFCYIAKYEFVKILYTRSGKLFLQRVSLMLNFVSQEAKLRYSVGTL